MSAQPVESPMPPAPPRRSRRLRLPFDPWHLVLAPIALVMLTPLAWMLITSIETVSETRQFPPVIIPSSVHWQNYSTVLTEAPFGRWFMNSMLVTIACVFGNLLFCSLAGYAFARVRFAGRGIAFFLILATLMVPFQVVMIPTFLIVRSLGQIDTLGALILPNLASGFGIFMMRQFFRTLPIELEEAARIDGATRLGVLFKIVLPLSTPALATLGVITFMWTWNDFLWPLITIYSEDKQTLQLGLTTFQGQHQSNIALLMAANVMSMAPILALFFAAQRWFVRGIATTGLK